MLSNLETEKEKLLQIILVGQPELQEKLTSPALRQLNERITVRYDLKHLAEDDIHNYIEHTGSRSPAIKATCISRMRPAGEYTSIRAEIPGGSMP